MTSAVAFYVGQHGFPSMTSAGVVFRNAIVSGPGGRQILAGTNRSRSIPFDHVRATHGSDRWTVETAGYGRATHTAPATHTVPALHTVPGVPPAAQEAHR